jgi:glyoxylase-like metal-dependent hydrolase (beta-lactamase superfamily II)
VGDVCSPPSDHDGRVGAAAVFFGHAIAGCQLSAKGRHRLRPVLSGAASRHGGEALIIDPVLEKLDRYLQLVRELDLKLVKVVDTHMHADHVTGPGALRDRTQCQ